VAGFNRNDTIEAKLDKLSSLLGASPNHDNDVQLLAELLSVPTGDRYPPLATMLGAQSIHPNMKVKLQNFQRVRGMLRLLGRTIDSTPLADIRSGESPQHAPGVDKVLEGLKGEGGAVLKTSLDHTKEEALKAALAGAQAAIPAATASTLDCRGSVFAADAVLSLRLLAAEA
jgi:hypothetical protein